MTIFYIWSLKFPKTAISGTDFDWPKTALTWGCSNIKLPLIVIVASHRSRDTYCACAVNSVAFIMGKRYFLPITWLNLRRSALKSDKVNRQIGVMDFKNVNYFCPLLEVT